MRLPRSLQWRVGVASGLAVALVLAAAGVTLAVVEHEATRSLAVIMLAAGLPAAAGAILVPAWLTRRAMADVGVVARGVRSLADGDFDHRIDVPLAVEVRDIAVEFNRTAATLRELVRDVSGERNKLLAVLETMADGVLVVDRDGALELANQGARSLLGLPSTATISTPLAYAVRDHELLGLVGACRDTGERQRAEVELLRGRRTVSAIATPLTDEDEGGVLLTLHDLTELREVETTRREFVSNVSHELRSPLASVKAMVETLEGGALDEHELAVDFLARIRRDVDRMNAIVTDLLELSRIEHGQIDLDIQHVDLLELVRDVCAGAEPVALAKQLTVSVHGDGGPPAAVDAAKLRQVVVNLVENAVKFTPPGGRVTVTVEASNGEAHVSVADTGVGIAHEHLSHVFERFYKVDRSRRDGGTGLGLAIAKHIVHAHGGDISLHSVEGEGSVFSFTVPLQR